MQSSRNQLYSGAIYTKSVIKWEQSRHNQLYSGAIKSKSVIQWGNLHKISYTVGQSTQNQLID